MRWRDIAFKPQRAAQPANLPDTIGHPITNNGDLLWIAKNSLN